MRARVVLSTLTAALLLAASASGATAARVDPALNHPETWQVPGSTTCVKTEVGGGVRSIALPADGSRYALLVIKAGTISEPFTQVEAGVAYAPSNGKEISHVIVCTEVEGDGGDDGGIAS